MQEIQIDEPAGRVRFKMPEAGATGKYHDEARGAHDEANKKRRNGARSVKPGPQDSQDEAGRDWRANISLHALQIDVKLAADLVDERHPQQAQPNHHSRRPSAHIHNTLSCTLPADL